MAKGRVRWSAPETDETREAAALLRAELRGRGMDEAEIEAALKKRKRRKALEFSAVKSRHLMEPDRARISDELCTVDFAAEQLKLHPKTVLRFIHEGRLRANRVGKAYRILRTDLEAFAGLPAAVAVEAPSVTSIVDVPGVGADLARRWARTVTGALNGRPANAAPLRAEVIYEPERSHLKIIVVGAPGDTLNLLSLIRAWLEQLGP